MGRQVKILSIVTPSRSVIESRWNRAGRPATYDVEAVDCSHCGQTLMFEDMKPTKRTGANTRQVTCRYCGNKFDCYSNW